MTVSRSVSVRGGRIGFQETVCLVTLGISAKVFFTSPAMAAARVGTAGWYMTLFSAAVAAIGFLVICLLIRRFPDADIVHRFEQALGHPVGFVFSGLLAAGLFYIAATRLLGFTEVLRTYVYSYSPSCYVFSFALACVGVMSLLGLESLARFSKLIMYIMRVSLMAVLVLGSQSYRLYPLEPILGYGLLNTVKAGAVRSSAYAEVILLAVFAQSFHGLKFILREGLVSLLLSGAIIGSCILCFSMAFSYKVARKLPPPCTSWPR